MNRLRTVRDKRAKVSVKQGTNARQNSQGKATASRHKLDVIP